MGYGIQELSCAGKCNVIPVSVQSYVGSHSIWRPHITSTLTSEYQVRITGSRNKFRSHLSKVTVRGGWRMMVRARGACCQQDWAVVNRWPNPPGEAAPLCFGRPYVTDQNHSESGGEEKQMQILRRSASQVDSSEFVLGCGVFACSRYAVRQPGRAGREVPTSPTAGEVGHPAAYQ